MYLITGGAGFIGSNIVRKLLQNGERVRLLDDFSTGKRENIADLNGAEVIEGSLLDDQILKQAVDGAEFILHQAAIPSVPRSLADPVGSSETNVNGTIKLLEAARQERQIKKFVFAASSSAYGDKEALPKIEAMPANPLSPYAINKYSGELYMKIYSEIYGLPTVSLRYFNIFGPYQDPASEYAAVIPKFILSMLKGEEPVIFGDGEQSRDFTYIDNAVEANLLACSSDKVGRGEVVNIACGERFSLNELVRALNDIMGNNLSAVYSDPRPGDIRHSLAGISKAGELLGYQVKVDFLEGLRRTVRWFQEQTESGA